MRIDTAERCRAGRMCLAASRDAPSHEGGNASAGAVLCRQHRLTQVFDDAEIETYFRRWLDAQSYMVRRILTKRYQLVTPPPPPFSFPTRRPRKSSRLLR